MYYFYIYYILESDIIFISKGVGVILNIKSASISKNMDSAITAQSDEVQEMHTYILELQAVTESILNAAVSTKEISDKVNKYQQIL